MNRHEATKRVLEYQPMKIDLEASQQAINYLTYKQQGSDFVMGTPLKVQTGILKIEEKKIEDLADEKMLEKLKDIQEQAYAEGKELGKDEGKREAYAHHSEEIEEALRNLNGLIASFGEIKSHLYSFNESHILNLVYNMAKLVVHREVTQHDEVILEVLRQAVSLSQEDENITVTVNGTQFEYIENFKQQTGREFDFLKKIKFVASDDVARGGCVVETNYGVIDSQIHQRLEQLYKNLIEVLPKSKNLVAV